MDRDAIEKTIRLFMNDKDVFGFLFCTDESVVSRGVGGYYTSRDGFVNVENVGWGEFFFFDERFVFECDFYVLEFFYDDLLLVEVCFFDVGRNFRVH